MNMVKRDNSISEMTPVGPRTSEQRVGALLHALRSERHLSVRTLASRAGCSPSFISQIEHGQASPSIASLEKIAVALGVTLSDFFDRAESAQPTVIRSTQRQESSSSWSRAQIESLGPTGTGHFLEPIMLSLGPNGRSGSQPFAHAGEQFAIIFEGTVTLNLDDDVYHLERGDAVTLPSDMPHQWENPGPHPAQIVIVSTRHPR